MMKLVLMVLFHSARCKMTIICRRNPTNNPTSGKAALRYVLDGHKSQGRSAAQASVVNALITHFANANRSDDQIDVVSEALYLL